MDAIGPTIRLEDEGWRCRSRGGRQDQERPDDMIGKAVLLLFPEIFQKKA
jgi:hypothetical protein